MMSPKKIESLDDGDLPGRSERLTAAMREIETFSLAIAHDFRIPLKAIEARILALSAHGQPLDTEVTAAMREIDQDAGLMLELLDRLLELGRLVVAPLALEAVDMESLAWDAWSEVPRSKGVDLRIGKLPRVQANRAMMKLVWLNLLCNAVTYTASTPAPRIEISGGATANAAVFGVRDNGRGYDLDYAGKLFYLFEKIQQQAERPGTGVGLAIVQRIVTRHRGSVWIEARGGEGSFMQFSLPMGDPR